MISNDPLYIYPIVSSESLLIQLLTCKAHELQHRRFLGFHALHWLLELSYSSHVRHVRLKSCLRKNVRLMNCNGCSMQRGNALVLL